MADVKETILKKYGVDVDAENILKLYRIDKADMSEAELDQHIADTRKRWNASINGANEKNAARDRARLERADSFEKILRDRKLRSELFKYYNGGTASGDSPSSKDTAFAEEYFRLIGTTKRITRPDVDFFFKYYQSERKNKKAILEMLSKKLKIAGLGSEGNYKDEEADQKTGASGSKGQSSNVIVNLFQEQTILRLRRAIEKYEEAKKSEELTARYPKLQEGLYPFLEIDGIKDAAQFKELMSRRAREVFAVRQERGTEYVPLVDLFNILQELPDNRDIRDNMAESKLLIKYPSLTPYMFAFVEMKPSTLSGMMDVAKRDCSFRDETDLILNYYQPLHDNFGISSNSISSIIKKAEKKARQNQLLNEIDKRLGRDGKVKFPSFLVELIHWLIYWPIFAVYLVFEIPKVIVTRLTRYPKLLFAAMLLLLNLILPKHIPWLDNILVLFNIPFKDRWQLYLLKFYGYIPEEPVMDYITKTAILLAAYLAVYLVSALLLTSLAKLFLNDFNKRFDWVGIERTFGRMLDTMKSKTIELYKSSSGTAGLLIKKLPHIIINIICLVFVLIILWFGGSRLDRMNRYMPNVFGLFIESLLDGSDRTDDIVETEEETEEALPDIIITITASAANIRTAPGTNSDVITTAVQGTVFIGTGNVSQTESGTLWYELWLDEERTQTGWASETVLSLSSSSE